MIKSIMKIMTYSRDFLVNFLIDLKFLNFKSCFNDVNIF